MAPNDVSELVAPGPGTWERDDSHFARTITPLMVELMEDAAPRGIREGFSLTGAPLETMDVRFVDGQMYRRLVPIIGGSGRAVSLPPPPTRLVKLAFKLHPRLRARAKLAERAFGAKTWLSEADRWDETWKPNLIDTNRRLGSVDLASLDDAGLAEHLEECLDHVRESAVLHFRLHISDLGPIANLLTRTTEWGLDHVEVMGALAGASPATSAPRDALRPLARELADHRVVPTSLDDVRDTSERAAVLLDGYLLDVGSRITTGYDLSDLTLTEMPQVILAGLRDPSLLDDQTTADGAAARGLEAVTRLRARVSETNLEEFDELVSDARRLYGLRDENGPLTYEWPAGVTRFAMLEAGRRLAERGALSATEHVFDLTRTELIGLILGRTGLGADVVEARRTRRLARNAVPAPEYLGPPPVEPDLAALPPAMAKMMGLALMVMAHLEADAPTGELTGTGIGSTPVTGRACVVADAAEAFDRVEPGDIIVTQFTAPTFNSVLALAGGVVTEHGGLLCHTAVIARELGIAAVVGVEGALSIPDGATIEVDPVAGQVRIVDA